MITNVEKLEFGHFLEIRCYERGCWQHDCYVDDLAEAVERMNYLCQEYNYKEDDVQLVKLTFFENIVCENPF